MAQEARREEGEEEGEEGGEEKGEEGGEEKEEEVHVVFRAERGAVLLIMDSPEYF